jgi:two-component system, NtrC family, response regulator HydG
VDVNVRVVSATNRNIREAIGKNEFREQLYDRINVIEIRLPPLRERAGDVRLLVHSFLKRYGLGRVTSCDESAMAALTAGGPLTGDARRAVGSLPLKDAKDQWMGVLEASYLRELLDRRHGNITAAAQAAGVDRKTFHRLAAKHGIR